MPIYRYVCGACQAKQDLFSSIAERDAPTQCPRCDAGMARQIAAPAVFGDYPGYECPRTGRWVEGRKAHLENLKRTGCRLLEPGETDALRKGKQKAEDDFIARIEDTVEQTIHEMPIRKREALTAELQNGADCEIVRRDDPPT